MDLPPMLTTLWRIAWTMSIVQHLNLTNNCGLCSQVGYNEADLGVTSFGCSHGYSLVLECSHAIYYGTTHWISKFNPPLPSATNIVRIYSTDCWIVIFIAIVSVSVFLVVAAKVGRSYGFGPRNYVDVALVPFR